MDLKKRFKLYKAKKNWLLAGITTLGVLFGSTVLASAATPTSSTTEATTVLQTPQTVAPQSSTENAQSVATQTAANNGQPASEVKAASSTPTQVTPKVNGTESYEQGHWYLKNSAGQPLNGWQNLSDNRLAYYSPETNWMQYGEQNIDGKWYFFDQVNGDVKTGWYQLPDGRRVYYDVQKGDHAVSGQGMLHGMQTVADDTYYYYFNPGYGTKESGLKQVNGQTYYFAPAQVRSAEVNLGGHWYYFKADGAMATGFTQLKDGRTVYYNPKGWMQYGEQNINGKWYFFDKVDGHMAKNWFTLPDGRLVYYQVDANGAGQGMLHGLSEINGQKYYFDPGMGTRRTGLQVVNGKTYYFNPAMVQTAEVNFGGHWYYFKADGTMATGFIQLKDGRTVYYNPKGWMQYGEQNIDGKWYFFNQRDGHMAMGWQTLPDGRKVYYDVDANGQGRGMLHGYNLMGGVLYNFDPVYGTLIGKVTNDLFYDATTGQLQYYNADGKLVKDQAVKLGNQTYQADAQGNLQITGDGEHAINGHWYLYDAKNGKLKTSWQTLADGRTVYYGPQAYMLYGHQTIDGHGYFFNRVNGDLTKGWLQDGHDWYYYNPNNGQAQTGTATINGVTYRFDNSGKQILNYAIDYRYALNAGEGDEDTAANNYIVLHEVGTESGGAANANYFKQDWEKVEAYTTFVVGDGGRVYQVGRPGQVSWGAGRVANHNAPVQIELGRTYNASQFWQDYTAYVRLARDMAGKFGIPLTLDAGGAGTRGIKSHNWVSHNIWGDHVDPYGYLARFGVTQAKLAHDLQYGI
ncbi:N-acetylmuramoyl-L-alanine amidase [Limosilactobacillus ingluviei]|uniref:N-acetylmuramoyl-L-alanine amidase n=1 Tax=Limosilactobacillus ingluviei TaxID=148604 RepID=UPI0024B9677E|nr:N-acetylmuramoyl-L-alanine amidase [Limosilactobacillus ingluviei]